MIIKELILKNFGKFSNQSFQMMEGINVVYGENEFGKSTIHSFIKSMLFGLERGRGRAAKKDNFTIYEPWENSNYYAGGLRFGCEDKTFILNRTFDKQSKKASLVCENDGEVLSMPHGDLDMLLGKLDGINYENTVSVAQRKSETTDELSAELKNFAANYHSRGDSDIQVEQVQVYLKNKKKEIESKIKEERNYIDNKREKLTLERDYIQRELERLATLLKENQKVESILKTKEGNQKAKFHVPLIPAIAIVVLICLVMFLVSSPWNVLTVIVIMLAVGLYAWNKLKHKTIGRNVKKALSKDIEKANWEKIRLESEYQEKQVILDNIEEQIKELHIIAPEEEGLLDKIAGLELAMERVEVVSRNIQKDFGRELNEEATKVFKSITNEKYSRVVVDEDLNVSVYREGRTLGLEQVSRGTVEQIYFSLRMAITTLLHTEELPVLLDDTFAYYDDKRLKSVLLWLYENKKQVIIFTCHRREIELLEELNLPFYSVV